MRKSVLVLLLLQVVVITTKGQDRATAVGDSLSFIRSKRMSAADLAKKREGSFVTGIPDLSSDPVTGFGFGVRTNIIWNGKRDNPLFAYTPYLMKLKANAAWYSSNARELVLSLDAPYYKGTRWRFKIDLKAQQNPANLYFGLTEASLSALRLPSDPATSFAKYRDFDRARKFLRPGQPGEAAQVTDALSNRFRETEFMLNLKADYALGNGRWRVMAGYEIQHLAYKTFEGTETDAIVPQTGQETKAPNGFSLLQRDYNQGSINGVNGGWVSIVQTALLYDTRDFEPDPTKGVYLELANEYAGKAIGSQFDFDKLLVQGRFYQQMPFGARTVLAGRAAIGNVFGKSAPFFEFQDQWSPDGSINALGGKQSLRGFRANRFLARSVAMANLEFRFRFAEISWGKHRFGFNAVPFIDAGTVRDRWQEMNFSKWRIASGGGLRIAWNQSTIISLDYGVSTEDRLLFFGIGQAF